VANYCADVAAHSGKAAWFLKAGLR
jgi:hypothetical protein